MIIRLPYPDPVLFPNRRNGHSYHKTHAAKVKARDGAFWATKEVCKAFSDHGGYIALSLLFIAPDKRRRDWDGLVGAFKACQDGVASALGVDDHRFKPVLVDWIQGGKPGCVVVAVGVQIVSSTQIADGP